MVWFLLHGYGELASDMLYAAAALDAPERLLVAPEALSRFYRRRGTGAVGASWMTREARESEIEDQVRYLDGLRAALADELSGNAGAARASVLGFSQGAAAACRWSALGSSAFERVVLWGALAPPDIDLARWRARLGAAEVELVLGRADPQVEEAALEREKERLSAAGIRCALRRFEGGHALDAPTLAALARDASRA
jgi:predicted esterase